MIIKWILSLISIMVIPNIILSQDNDSSAMHGQFMVPYSQLTLKAAYALTEASRAAATEMGRQVTIAIVDQSGVTILLSRGDGVGPHNTEAARRKAYTALSTKTSTLTLARN